MTQQPEALRLADALRMLSEQYPRVNAGWAFENLQNAAAELRRLHAENGALKKAVALLQQHHATAWNRGHMMGMKANEDTARRALDAVKQDAWGNTQLTEALLKAEEQRDALLEALKELTPPMPPADAPCHVGLVPQEKCAHCGRIARARAAIKAVEGEKT